MNPLWRCPFLFCDQCAFGGHSNYKWNRLACSNHRYPHTHRAIDCVFSIPRRDAICAPDTKWMLYVFAINSIAFIASVGRIFDLVKHSAYQKPSLWFSCANIKRFNWNFSLNENQDGKTFYIDCIPNVPSRKIIMVVCASERHRIKMFFALVSCETSFMLPTRRIHTLAAIEWCTYRRNK